jgi:hypothetical protein
VFLEFDGKTIVPLNFSVADIRDITKRKGSFSKSITIPGTKNNNRVLNNYFDVNVEAGTFDINKLQRCTVIQDDIPVLDNALMQLVSVNKVQTNNSYESDVTYTLLIKDTTSDFFSNINNKTLDQLDFNWMSHIYNASNVVASFDNTVVDGYKYVMPYNAAVGDNDAQYSLPEFTPAIYAKQYWDQIFAGSGFTYDWPGLTGPAIQFDKLLIPYNGDTPSPDRTQSQFYGFSADGTPLTTQTSVFLNLGSAPYPAYNFKIYRTPINTFGANNEISDTNNVYTPGTATYTMPNIPGVANRVVFNYSVSYSVTIRNTSAATRYLVGKMGNGNTYPPSQYPLRCSPTITMVKPQTINGIINNSIYTDRDLSLDNGGTALSLPHLYAIPGNTTINLIARECNGSFILEGVVPGSTYFFSNKLEFTVPGVPPAAGGNNSQTGFASPLYHWSSSNTNLNAYVKDVFFDFKVDKVSLSSVMQLEGEVGFNVPIYMNKFIPQNIKQNEFVKSILQMYNLYVEVDKEIPTKLNIYQRDSYYDSGKEEDWTDKLVKNKPQDLKFLPEITNKKLLLTYKEDKDWANTNYKSNTNEVYGQAEYVFDNEYVKDTTKVELIFSPTPTANTSFGAVCPIWNGQAPKTNIRILYDGGQKPCGPYAIWNYGIDAGATGFTGATASAPAVLNNLQVYPHINHWDKTSNPTFDLQFLPSDYYYRSDDWGVNTNNNLFNLHWRRTANQLNTGKLLSAYFDLNSTDIQKMRLNDKIRIDNSWWNINKIQDYDANSKAPTKVELISVDDLLSPPFVSTDSVGVSRTSNLWPDQRTLNYEQSRIRNTIYSEGDVSVNGVNNIVSESVISADIVGDNNNISSDSIIRGSFNSAIESTFIIGDSNTVPEGATNVMIVGNGITASATGGVLYADNLEITNNGTINGIPVSSVISGDLFWSAGTAAQSIKQKDTLASATGIRSFSVGQGIGINGSIASGQDSVAFAGGNASGLRSFAHGIAAAAIGQDSVAFTSGSATGLNSFSHAGSASGSLSSSFSGGSADGGQSHAVGDGALAQTYSETVVGINSSSITGNSGAYSASDPAFRVGNGTSNVTRSDAFRVYKNGAAYLKPITTASVTSPVTGMIILDSSDNRLKVYNGSAWISSSATQYPTTTTGTSIDWVSEKIYNTAASPATGNFTSTNTGANLGVIQKIYHNSGTAPTYPANWVLVGGAYVISSLNIIYAEYSSSTRVEYWIIN